MKILHLLAGNLGVNVYFLINEENKALIIDAGDNYSQIKAVAEQHNLTVTDCVLTHGHFDHSGACAKLQKDGVKIHISSLDADKLTGNGNLALSLGFPFENLKADSVFEDGDVLDINGFKLKVMLTPGHSKGSVCLFCDDVIFSGDTLFFEGIGRTDFYDGDYLEMKTSLQKLLSLDKNYLVYPGHGRATNIEHEKKYNPYL